MLYESICKVGLNVSLQYFLFYDYQNIAKFI